MIIWNFNIAFSSTEKELNTKCVVEMVKNQTVLHPATLNLGKGDSRYVSQDVGSGILCGICALDDWLSHYVILLFHVFFFFNKHIF